MLIIIKMISKDYRPRQYSAISNDADGMAPQQILRNTYRSIIIIIKTGLLEGDYSQTSTPHNIWKTCLSRRTDNSDVNYNDNVNDNDNGHDHEIIIIIIISKSIKGLMPATIKMRERYQ